MLNTRRPVSTYEYEYYEYDTSSCGDDLQPVAAASSKLAAPAGLDQVDTGQLAHVSAATQHASLVAAAKERIDIQKCMHPMELRFANVRLQVDGPAGKKEILHGVSGRVQPGQFLAILGPSGAGKTSLLKVLGGRLRPSAGSVTYNDQAWSPAVRSSIGYVLQEDFLFSELTVRETLRFAALLRLPSSMTREQKLARVEALISAFKLSKCADTRIGGVTFAGYTPGISGGEKKRVSCAVEFLFDPSIIMLDEPTSGLDASTALAICVELGAMALSGRTVVTTIHQPSSVIFSLFDLVCLMENGSIAYFGPAGRIVAYFNSIGLPPPVHYNPADYVVEIASSPEYRNNMDLAGAFDQRKLQVCPELAVLAAEGSASAGAGALAEFDDQRPAYSTGFFAQLGLLTGRAFKQQRGDVFTKINFANYTTITIIMSAIWFQMRNDAQSVNSRVGLLFFLLLYLTFDPIFHVLLLISGEIAILKKERQSGMYRLSAYYIAKSLADVPVGLAFPLAIMTVTYWATGLSRTAGQFFVYLLTLVLQVLTAQSIGLLVSSAIVNLKKAMVTVGLVMLGMVLLGGFYASADAIPFWLDWARYCSVVKYSFEALLINEYRIGTVPCKHGKPDNSPFSSCPVTEADIRAFYGTNLSMWENIAVVASMAVGFRIIAFFFLKFNKTTK